MVSTTSLVSDWINAQKSRAPKMKGAPTFYRNLEEALDARRAEQSLAILRSHEGMIDVSSNDFLSLSSSGLLRTAFLEELSRNPGFQLGSCGSRLLGGNSTYLQALEQEIANFHIAETALVLNSGYDGNAAIFSAIPRPGDAIVFDELVHASVHDGMKHSLTPCQVSFRHNDVESFRETLVSLIDSQPLIRKGARCVIIAIESVYSMDGDFCPLRELVEVAKELFPTGNAQFVVDEAHSTGVIGENGRGLVCALGLEKEIAVRLHTYGKALGATGAAILSNETVRTMLLNFARAIIYTTAPSFPMLAAIRAGYTLMRTGLTQKPQERVRYLVKHFCKVITSNPVWDEITDAGVLSIPLSEEWESRQFTSQFMPVWTRQGYNYYLVFHLQLANFFAFPIGPPVVPRGTGRVRLVIHAANTEAQLEALASSICEWGQEMLEIEEGRKAGVKIPSAVRKVYALMATLDVKSLNPSTQFTSHFVD